MDFLFTIIFIFAFGVFAFSIIKSFCQWVKNNHSPRLTVDAVVTGKREETDHTTNSDATGVMTSHSSTTYHVTFEVESSDRMEFRVSSFQYAMVMQGDKGKLTFQGTRFLNFERTRQDY